MSQLNLWDETKKRDAALDLLEERRESLVEYAKALAYKLYALNGEVSSPEILAVMKDDSEIKEALTAADPRFMGAVFRKGWKRLRWDATGSHRRPVSVWVRS